MSVLLAFVAFPLPLQGGEGIGIRRGFRSFIDVLIRRIFFTAESVLIWFRLQLFEKKRKTLKYVPGILSKGPVFLGLSSMVFSGSSGLLPIRREWHPCPIGQV